MEQTAGPPPGHYQPCPVGQRSSQPVSDETKAKQSRRESGHVRHIPCEDNAPGGCRSSSRKPTSSALSPPYLAVLMSLMVKRQRRHRRRRCHAVAAGRQYQLLVSEGLACGQDRNVSKLRGRLPSDQGENTPVEVRRLAGRWRRHYSSASSAARIRVRAATPPATWRGCGGGGRAVSAPWGISSAGKERSVSKAVLRGSCCQTERETNRLAHRLTEKAPPPFLRGGRETRRRRRRTWARSRSPAERQSAAASRTGSGSQRMYGISLAAGRGGGLFVC